MAYGGNIAALGFLSGMFLLYNGIKKYTLLQKIKNTPTSKVQSAAVGLVKLYGTAEPRERQLSPISKKPCVYWMIKVEYKTNIADKINNLDADHSSWRPIGTFISGNPFCLNDKTGKIIVDSNPAQVEIPINTTYAGHITGKGLFGKTHKKIDESAVNFINSLPDNYKNMAYKNGHIRVLEYYIAENDNVYVLGNAEIREGIHSDVGHKNLIVRSGKYDKIMYVGSSSDPEIIRSLASSLKWNIGMGFILSSVCLVLMLVLTFMA